MLIAVVNRSSNVQNSDVETMCKAIQLQLNLHFLPAWNIKSGTVKFYADESKVENWAWLVSLVDDDTVPGALGYHEETGDKVQAFIMTNPILQNGGTVLKFDPSNPGQYTVSATLSHEVLESCNNAYTNLYADDGTGKTSYAFEMCDPVEQIGYGIEVDNQLVSVSDFIFPSWTNPQASKLTNMPFNYLKTLEAPFTILAGGYTVQRDIATGQEKQVFGKDFAEWKKPMKNSSFARMQRRKNIK